MVGIALYRLSSVTFFRCVDAAEIVVVDSLYELAHTQFHVVEVRDGLTEFLVEVRQHCLEIAEGLACVV